MAFRKITNFNPDKQKIDPRVDDQWVVNSSHIVLAVNPWPTYKECLANGGPLASDMIGLLNSHSVSESTNVTPFYEVGNKAPILIPGKSSGGMTLSSGMVESMNILGSIYETVLKGLNSRFGNIFKPTILDDVMSRPDLSTTYFSDPKSNIVSDLVASKAATQEETSNKGAILLSIHDIRLKVKFGIVFMMFQSEKRITTSAFSTSGFNINQLAGDQAVQETQYKLMSGIFYENCLLNSYGRAVNTDSGGNNINETVNIIYSDVKKINTTVQKKEGTALAVPSISG